MLPAPFASARLSAAIAFSDAFAGRAAVVLSRSLGECNARESTEELASDWHGEWESDGEEPTSSNSAIVVCGA